ncbi:hypothetical protein AVEN_44542-1 [Araneus ventricosus]|uniref:Uncharacterized protein n=1 Tax=Araneus ventricosus TaxID=182803 RepID=A0A4Y2F835_ARAVE|nr:hypothetical protein AVEN_44542-1 [Araneus ventricosus]
MEILITTVNITVKGKNIPAELIVLKNSRGNRALLGVDFLSKAGIVLDLQKKHWYFSTYPERKYNFIESPPDINAQQRLVVPTASNPCQLRENKGASLSSLQKVKLNSLLEEYENCFQPGGEPTPFIENKIDTGNHLPVAVPPNRLSPARQ